MPSPEEVAADVREIFARTLKLDPEKLVPEANLQEDLELDSLDMIEAVYEVEDHFDVQIPEDALKDIRTFQEVVDGLCAALASKG